MKYFFIATIIVFLLMPLACGNGEDAGGEKSNTQDTGAKKHDTQKAEPDTTSNINVSFAENEINNPGAFELKKTIGYISGMRYNANATAKLAYVVFANYPVKLSSYGSIIPPTEEGQIAIVTAFKTDNLEIPMAQQMVEYNKMKVPTGLFKPKWMGKEKSLQVSYWVAKKNGVGLSDQGASGSATLTASTPDFVSGTIDFTSAKGSVIKGSFKVTIEKDFWKR